MPVKDHARQKQLLQLLADNPKGLTAAQVGAALGLTLPIARQALGRLRLVGKIDLAQQGNLCLWAMPADVPAILQALAENRQQILQERRALADELRPDDSLLAMRRVIAPAADCAPPVTRAPRSVFELASH